MLEFNILVDPGTSNPIHLRLQTWVKDKHPKFFASFQWVAIYDAKYLSYPLFPIYIDVMWAPISPPQHPPNEDNCHIWEL